MTDDFRTTLLSITLALLPLACGAENQDQAAPGDPPAAASQAGTVMDRALDGSTPEAFAKGLERVKSEASPQEYRELTAALDWLLFYDYAAGGDKAALYKILDGSSPREIIQRVKR